MNEIMNECFNPQLGDSLRDIEYLLKKYEEIHLKRYLKEGVNEELSKN